MNCNTKCGAANTCPASPHFPTFYGLLHREWARTGKHARMPPPLPRNPRQQKAAKRYEDMLAGRYRPAVEDPARLDGELAAAGAKLDGVLGLVDALRGAAPHLGEELSRVLAHVEAA